MTASYNLSQLGSHYNQGGTGAVDRTTASKLQESVSVLDFGAVGDGSTDDTNAIVNANTAAISAGKTLLFPGGKTYLVSSSLTFSGKCNWRFEGASGTTSSDLPQTYLIKKSTVSGDLLTFTGSGIVLDGVAIVGQAGNSGTGITLLGNSPVLYRPFVTGCGSHGIRLGNDTSGANVNSFSLYGPRCISNTGCGIYLHDNGNNANAGLIASPICTSNGSHGFYGNKASLGVTIITPTFEANTGYGAYLDTYFGYIGANSIIGGDIEANTGGNLYQAVAYQCELVGVNVQGKTYNSRAQAGSFVPVITGASTAGTATYSTQLGSYTVSGGSVTFFAHITWTGHTGTGQAYINLPLANYTSTPVPDYTPVSIVSNSITLAAGAQLQGLINRTGSRIQIYQTSAGSLSAISVPASGDFYITGTYPANVPNYNYV